MSPVDKSTSACSLLPFHSLFFAGFVLKAWSAAALNTGDLISGFVQETGRHFGSWGPQIDQATIATIAIIASIAIGSFSEGSFSIIAIFATIEKDPFEKDPIVFLDSSVQLAPALFGTAPPPAVNFLSRVSSTATFGNIHEVGPSCEDIQSNSEHPRT